VAVGEDSTNWVDLTDAAEDGSWQIDLLDPSSVRLRIENNGVTRWIGGTGHASATVFQGTAGQITVTPAQIENGIECRFESDIDQEELDPDVALVDSTGMPVLGEYFSASRENPIPIPGLEPGRYFLKVLDSPYRPWAEQWYDRADSLSRATPIQVESGGTVTRITMHLSPREIR